MFQALEQRRTTRAIRPDPLPLQTLSNLLWAAFGVNRQNGPFGMTGRTAASASNSQEIDVYVALADTTHLYDPLSHVLSPVAAGDLRASALTPGQPVGEVEAPVQLIYVVDLERLEQSSGFDEPGLRDPEVQKSYYYVDTGLIAANVYLFAAGERLATWFHNCDRQALAIRLALSSRQHVLFAQSVGHPQKRRDP
ncbi:MAG TPA: nitroreductase family protein [Gammaproteobacteria bacterium]|nr:nitroreductase family protein [Gammaproteobacteria bacterium]